MRKAILAGALIALPLPACGSETGSGDAGSSSDAAAAEELVESPPVQSPVGAADPVRSSEGLEDKCHDAVAAEGVTVLGTERIEESEAAIEIYVNVDGGEAPWRCLGNRDGTIEEVMYTGSEGGL